jgi:hypothetical protein
VRFELVIRVSTDPLVRLGYRERSAELRLRILLKQAVRGGFKVESVRPIVAEEKTA